MNPLTDIHRPCKWCHGEVLRRPKEKRSSWRARLHCSEECAGSSFKAWNRFTVPFEAGVRFGALVTVEDTSHTVGKKRKWVCRCDCGTVKAFDVGNLRAGNTTSCGCWRRDPARASKASLPYGEASARSAWSGYLAGAKKRGLTVEIDFEDFKKITQRNCVYCGAEPSNRFELKHPSGSKKGQPRCNGPFIYNGIDRFDSRVGYTRENCLPCCARCNIAKNDMAPADFIEWINKVYGWIIGGGHETVVAR